MIKKYDDLLTNVVERSSDLLSRFSWHFHVVKVVFFGKTADIIFKNLGKFGIILWQ